MAKDRFITTIIGVVVDGKKRGRELGYPTANISPINFDVNQARHGAYASYVRVDGIVFKALTSVGPAITFEATEAKVEPHILDFNKDIYGEVIKVFLIERLRPMIKFDSGENLAAQFKKDCIRVREILQ